MAVNQVVADRQRFTANAAAAIYDAMTITEGMKPFDPRSKKDVLFIRSRLADALIDLHNAGIECPQPLPRDPLAKKMNRA